MRRGDEGVSDFIGTLLLVATVVVLGSVISVAVTANLQRASPPSVSLGLAPMEAGDATARIVLRNGETLTLGDVSIGLQRNASSIVDVPSTQWSTIDPLTLRAGETLTFPLSPVAGQDETFRVIVTSRSANAVVGTLQARTPFLLTTASPLGTPTLVASFSSASIVADASNRALLTVRVSHPAGALGVASVTADLRNLTNASGSASSLLPLSDAGSDGDVTGGDGVWSGLVSASINTTVGTYNVTVNATDLTGRLVASTYVSLSVSSNLATIVSNVTSLYSDFTNFTGNFTGTCTGCTVTNGTIAYEGTRLNVPTSQNISTFVVRNWTWDRLNPDRLDGDAFVARIIGNTYAWSMYVRLDYSSNTPKITRLEVWNANATTVYRPTSTVSINGLALNMMSPTANGFTCDSGCTTPMLYQNANIQGDPVFVISWMRDETNNFQTDDLGIYSLDASVS